MHHRSRLLLAICGVSTLAIGGWKPPLLADEIQSQSLSPASVELHGPRSQWQLIATAQTSEGERDVTHLGAFRSSDERIARVTAHGLVFPVADGAAKVIFALDAREASADVIVASMASASPVSFAWEVIPVLTKAGCNSGKCHGSPSGKGGFAISLRGFDRASDLGRLTRQHGGRRIDLVAPEESLLLRKPTATIPHGGGRRFGRKDASYRILADWIAAGAPDDPAGGLAPTSLEIFPATRWLDARAASQQLSVLARFSDGTRRDVTHLSLLSLSDSAVADLSPAGLVTRTGGGEVAVAAAYGPLHAVSQLVFLADRPNFTWPNPPEENYIDRHVFAKLKRLKIAPAELADDATFARRAFLDVCGVLPTPDEVRSFLALSQPNKRGSLIAGLLERPEYADFWGLKWADRLGCNQRFVGIAGAQKYHRWICHQIAANVPEDQLVRSILTASGGNYTHPAASFYRLPRTAEDRAEYVAQVFLGVRIGCARCHNHPQEGWTQDDYFGLAAFFSRLKYRDGPFFNHLYDKEETVILTRSGELSHGRTGAAVAPRLLGGQALPPDEIDADDRRGVLAAWLASSENPLFARAAVNQIWFHLFGRGIVEPIDDFRASNPPANTELLDALAQDFIAHQFDRKYLLGQIMSSRTYQLSSTTNETNATDERYFSHAFVRRLSAEQLLDAVGQATGVPEKFSGYPLGFRAVQLPDGEFVHHFLSAFGRPARSLACACERDNDSTLGQALELVGSELVESKLQSADGRVARLLNGGLDDERLIEECYLATLCRLPTPEERQLVAAQLRAASDRREAVGDLVWTLVNHREFLFQH